MRICGSLSAGHRPDLTIIWRNDTVPSLARETPMAGGTVGEKPSPSRAVVVPRLEASGRVVAIAVHEEREGS